MTHRVAVLLCIVVAVAATLGTARPANADCAGVIAQLKPIIARITDPQLQKLVMLDLRQAHVELMEADEDECAMFVIHAARLMGCKRC